MKSYQHNKIKKLKKEAALKILIFVILFLILFLLIKAIGKTYLRSHEVAKEKEKIQLEIERLEQQKRELEEKIKLYQDPNFLEKEARRKLNLQKEGEQAVVILPNEGENSKITEPVSQKTIWEKIRDWFFKLRD